MAKVKFPGPPGTITPRIKGVFITQADPRRGYIARAWRGKQPASTYTAYQIFKQLDFAFLSQLWKGAQWQEYETAINWAKGTSWLWRDWLTAVAQGRGLVITDQFGNLWPNARDVDPNPQFILDLITTQQGSLIFRDNLGWMGIDKGADGSVLTLVSGKPQWSSPLPPVRQRMIIGTVDQDPETNQTFTGGNLDGIWRMVPAGFVADSVKIWITIANAAMTFQPFLYTPGSPGQLNLLAVGPPVSTGLVGIFSAPFAAPYTFPLDTLAGFGFVTNAQNCSVPKTAATFGFQRNGTAAPPNPLVGPTALNVALPGYFMAG